MSHPSILPDSTPLLPLPHDIAEPVAEGLDPRPKRFRVIVGLALAIALGGLGAIAGLRHAPQFTGTEAEPMGSLPVEIEAVSLRTIRATQTLMGTVEPVETVTTTSRVMGQIRSLPVQEGDRVQAGQVLAQIDVNDLQAQRNQATAAITQAEAGVSVSQAAVMQALTLHNQAIAQFNQAEARRSQANAQRQEAQVDLANAQLQQRRMASLQADGAVSQAQLDDANTRVDLIQARIQQAQAGIEQANRGVQLAQAAVDQAKAGIRQANAGVEQARSQVDQAKAEQQRAIANLGYGVVTAPFAGVVTRKHTEVGAMAGPGQPLVTLESTHRLRLSVEVPESLIYQIRQGDGVTIHLDATNQVLTGHIHQVIPSAHPNSRSFTVKVALQPLPSLMAGMFGRLELPRSTRQAITIPQTALMQRGQLEGVFVVGPRHQAELRWVKTGKGQDNRVEITAGLVEGDRVITTHVAQLRDSQPIVVKP